jgi:hypothetical protein
MSELEHALELFEFTTLDDVTLDSLKRAFKIHILRSHPDKGGDAELFDRILQAYVYLTETIQRISGGRATLQNIISPNELKEMRPDEIINKFFEEFHNADFNTKFEEQNYSEKHGYESWLKNTEEDSNLTDGEFGTATQKKPNFNEKELNSIFEIEYKKDKSETNSSIILHPEEMAYISGNFIGTDIIETNETGYTSQVFTNPEYTDVYSAFTTNNTVYDKLPSYTENTKSLDEIITERNKEISPFNDSELKAIQDYEKKKLDKNINNLSKVKDHFMYDDKYQTNLTNWPPEKYTNDAYKGFIINF